MTAERDQSMGVVSVVAIGMGGMIGAGIFALLGIAVSIAGAGVWMSFLIGGLAALASSYSFARLAAAFPSQGGAATYINRAYPSKFLAGSLNVLLWLGYVVVLSLYAHAFGAYAARLLGVSTSGLVAQLLMTASVVAFGALNLLGGRVVGRAESVLVYVKVAVLVVFAVAGGFAARTGRLGLSEVDGAGTLLAGGVLFLAYEGFGLMANTAEEVRNPERDLPRAFMIAVAGVMVVYVAVSLAAVGVAGRSSLVEGEDYALAVAARGIAGSWAFTAIALTAVVSTAGSLNATLYGAAKVSYVLGLHGELPDETARTLWGRPLGGLVATIALVVAVTNTVDLTGISIMGSSAFLLIYAAVNLAALRLRADTHVRPLLSYAGAALCLASLAAVCAYAATRDPAKLLVLAGMPALALAVETVVRKAGDDSRGNSRRWRSGGEAPGPTDT